jgi:hypothetical protein
VAIELDRNQPDFLGSIDAADVPAKGSELENAYNCHVGAGVILRDWHERERQIDSDPNLTASGKADAKAKALPEFEKRLSYLDSALKPLEQRMAASEQELSGATIFKSDSPADAVRATEIRAFFKSLDRSKGIALLHEAVKSGDDESQALIAAIVTAPTYMGLIPVEIRNALIAATVERRFPDKLAHLERSKRVVGTARYGLTRASELLSKHTPAGLRERFIRG